MRTSFHNAKTLGLGCGPAGPGRRKTLALRIATRGRALKSKSANCFPLAEELKIVIAIEESLEQVPAEPTRKWPLTFLNSKARGSGHGSTSATSCSTATRKIGFATLGSQIYKVHLKDFKRGKNSYNWANLGDGDIDWRAVRAAFLDIGYNGSVIAELEAGDEAYLKDVSRRIDKLLITGS